MPTSAPALLLATALERRPSLPLVTYYDDATGERTELSAVTFDNWVAKTANLAVDGLGLTAGARVQLRLPLHWQTAVWLAACWALDATVCVGDAGTIRPDLVVCGPHGIDSADADEVVALSLRPWGAGFDAALPTGVTDYAAEVAAHGDRFGGAPGAGPRSAATALTEVDGTILTASGLVDSASEAAARWSLDESGRLLTTLEPTTLDGLLALLPASLAVGGSVVLARGYSDTEVQERLAGENLSARAG